MKTLTIGASLHTVEGSTLITNANYHQYLSCDGTYHTSIGDCCPANILDFAVTVDVINYLPDRFDELPLEHESAIHLLNYLYHSGKINNYHLEPLQTFLTNDVSGISTPCLWVFGCSWSCGDGIPKSDRYTSILSKKLNLPLQLIAKHGSSTRWSLRHLMNVNIKPNDTVVWQLSTINRFSIKESDTTPVTEKLLVDMDKNFVAKVNFEQTLFDHLSLVNYGVNYLRAKGVKFKFYGGNEESSYIRRALTEFTKYPEYCYIPDIIVDVAPDNMHPGIISHQNIAKRLYNALTNL